MVNGLYIYSAVLLLFKTLQNKSRSYTLSYSAAIYHIHIRAVRGNLRLNVMPKDTLACRLGEAALKLLTFRLEADCLYILSHNMNQGERKQRRMCVCLQTLHE